ncbi:MAG: 4'-phosphopantetheinyl transferase superfamily protein [Luminiphilus sp.]|jgi:phosphopantetheinyl transferase|nr:4'-phosphopantetheinyl transferase superfamily protein [Luminiphilus sp.]MDG1461891.1 4'-phosphopantetheinyl transferase superfamily protein [Luminiphilus sp.]MDG1770890.1 4'-phosphopantetheinyl transferase superfamily protein [Luminiphilus sp.]
MITLAFLPDTENIPLHAIAQWRSGLSSADQQRIALMKGEPRKTEFVVTRKLLQTLAQQRLGVAAEVVSATGTAPMLLTADGRSIACSISHSHNAILVAINTLGAVGVDIEHHRPRSVAKVVERYFWSEGQTHFTNCSEAEGMAWFYRQWCMREALVKHQGDGNLFQLLGTPLKLTPGIRGLISQNDTTTVAVISSGEAEPELCFPNLEQDAQWTFSLLNPETHLADLTPLPSQ